MPYPMFEIRCLAIRKNYVSKQIEASHYENFPMCESSIFRYIFNIIKNKTIVNCV
jgi:hypothetical protein